MAAIRWVSINIGPFRCHVSCLWRHTALVWAISTHCALLNMSLWGWESWMRDELHIRPHRARASGWPALVVYLCVWPYLAFCAPLVLFCWWNVSETDSNRDKLGCPSWSICLCELLAPRLLLLLHSDDVLISGVKYTHILRRILMNECLGMEAGHHISVAFNQAKTSPDYIQGYSDILLFVCFSKNFPIKSFYDISRSRSLRNVLMFLISIYYCIPHTKQCRTRITDMHVVIWFWCLLWSSIIHSLQMFDCTVMKVYSVWLQILPVEKCLHQAMYYPCITLFKCETIGILISAS